MSDWNEPPDHEVDFFISYRGTDQAWAEWIGAELEAAGTTVRMRAWDAVAGENSVTWMSRQIVGARRTIALYSPAYFQSRWCMTECTTALSRATLLPVKVARCDPPAILAATGHVSLHDLDEAGARERLLAAVQVRAAPRRGVFPGGPDPAAARDGEALGTAVPFPGILPTTWNVRPRSVVFVGRDGLLARVCDRFRSAGPGRVVSQVLGGMGGAGKTQLAIEYAYRFAARYSLVWWVNAADPSALVESFDGLADALGLADDPDRARRARRALDLLRNRSDWLVVFDNVEDRRHLADWWPTGSGGNILVTGRSRALGEFGEMHQVGPFVPDESAALLRRRASHLSDGDAVRIAAAVGHLPLAVAQAAAYVWSTGMTADTYLDLLTTAMSMVFEDSPVDYPAGLLGSVTTAMDRVQAQDHAAAHVLRLAAFLAPAPVTPGILAGLAATVLPDLRPVVATTRVLRAIGGSGLGQIASETFELHRLTQAVLRDRVTSAERDRLTHQAEAVLARATPSDPGDPGAWPACAGLEPHVHALFGHLPNGGHPPFRAAILAVGGYLIASGQYPAAAELAGEVANAWRRIDGPDHPDTLAAAHLRGEALRGSGQFAAAETADSDIYRRRVRLLGVEDRESLRAADAVGLDLRGLGDRVGARAWHAEALAIARAILGPDDPQTLELASNLALELHSLNDIPAARELDEDTLIRRRRLLGDEHPQTLSSARNVARDLRALGLHAQARDLAATTLRTSRTVLGADHPDTLLAASSLAVLHYALGDPQAARELHEDTLRRSARVLGEDHPHTLRIANSLGVDLFELGDARGACALHRDTLDRQLRTLGADHPESLHTAHNLGRDLEGIDRRDEAVAILRDTLDRRTRVLGPEHSETRRTRDRLARALNRTRGD